VMPCFRDMLLVAEGPDWQRRLTCNWTAQCRHLVLPVRKKDQLRMAEGTLSAGALPRGTFILVLHNSSSSGNHELKIEAVGTCSRC